MSENDFDWDCFSDDDDEGGGNVGGNQACVEDKKKDVVHGLGRLKLLEDDPDSDNFVIITPTSTAASSDSTDVATARPKDRKSAEGGMKREQSKRKSDDIEFSSLTNSLTKQSEIPKFGTDGLPVNWTGLIKGGAFHLLELKAGQKEYDEIAGEFRSSGIEIVKIERIENARLLDRFKTEMTDMGKHREEGFSLHARYLYHGTCVDKKTICEEGLDQRLSCMGFFGRGIYFSDSPAKSIQYTENIKSQKTESYILRCRVLLGVQKIYPKGQHDRSLKKEPPKDVVKDAWKYYDSVIGKPKDHNEFVVYDNRRAMIEYVITVKPLRRDQKTNRSHLSTSQRSSSSSLGHQRSQFSDFYDDDDADTSTGTRRDFLDDVDVSPEAWQQDDLEVSRDVTETDEEQSRELAASTYDDDVSDDEQSRELLESAPIDDDFFEELHAVAAADDEYFFEELHAVAAADDDTKMADQRDSTQVSASEPGRIRILDYLPDEGNLTSDAEISENDTELIMNLNLSEFMSITNIDSWEMAQDFLQRANLDVNRAIALFYEELP